MLPRAGFLTDGQSKANLVVTVDIDSKPKSTKFVSGPQNHHLDYSCEGVTMRISLPDDDDAAAAYNALTGTRVSVTIDTDASGGLYDTAGNAAVPIIDRALAAGRAQLDRRAIATKVDGVEMKVESVGAKVGSASNKTQDLVLNLKSDVSDVKTDVSDVKSHLDALNQSNAETKGAIASLTSMVAILLQANGVEPGRFPSCPGPALYSFARHIKGGVPRGAATPVAAATAAVCAGKCLEAPACTAFSFSAGDGCRLATRDLGTDYDFTVRSRLHVRLTECTK